MKRVFLDFSIIFYLKQDEFFYFLLTFTAVYAETLSPLPCQCRLNSENRIVNGKVAPINFIPWMVSLQYLDGSHFCGGTIINDKTILTAAHCIKGKNPIFIRIAAGFHDLKKINGDQRYYIEQIIEGNADRPGSFGDFALIILKKPISFIIGQVEPACLNLADDNFEGDLMSAGWGQTARTWLNLDDKTNELNFSSKETEKLKYYFSTQDNEGCEIHDICVKAKNEGDSACNGDSGGPLMHTKNGITSVIGIASFVSSVVENNKMYYCNGLVSYSRVKAYRDLIVNNVDQLCSEDY